MVINWLTRSTLWVVLKNGQSSCTKAICSKILKTLTSGAVSFPCVQKSEDNRDVPINELDKTRQTVMKVNPL